MKTKTILLSLTFWFLFVIPIKSQDRIDSLLTDNFSDLKNVNLYDLFYDFKDVLKKACAQTPTSNYFQVINQGKGLCLISQARIDLQVFINNYLFIKKENFSVTLFYEDTKFIFLVNHEGDGGYFKGDLDGHIVLNSVFMSNDRFRPMTKNEILYFHEKILKALYLTKESIK